MSEAATEMEREDIGMDELAAKTDQVRKRVHGEKRDPAALARAEIQKRTREVECPGCGRTREVVQAAVEDPRDSTNVVWIPRIDLGQICVLCDATAEAAIAADQRARELEDRRGRILTILDGLGINVREHGRATLENFDDSEAGPEPVEAVHDFLDRIRSADRYDPVRGLYLYGTTGNGKTHLAVAAIRELLTADLSWQPDQIVYDYAPELITWIQETYDSDESTRKLLDRRTRARIWVLDDLGSEQPSADVVRRLTLILSKRALHPTLITGNYSPAEFEQRAEDFFRVGSRLGPRYFEAVEVRGRDRRHDD